MKHVVGMGMAAFGLAMVAGCVYVPPGRRPPPDVYYREPQAVIIVGGHDRDRYHERERERERDRERRLEPQPLPRRDMERHDRRDERYREIHRRDNQPQTGRAVGQVLDRFGRPGVQRPQPYNQGQRQPNRNAAQHRRSAGHRQNTNNDHRSSHGQGRPDESSQQGNSDRTGD